jgi:hypothetical protein
VPRSAPLGGSNRAAMGAGETFRIRQNELLIWRPRFTDAEYEAVHGFVMYAMTLQPFTLRPAHDDAATERECDLESPRMGDEEGWQPERAEFHGHWTTELIVRAVDGAPWHLPFLG